MYVGGGLLYLMIPVMYVRQYPPLARLAIIHVVPLLIAFICFTVGWICSLVYPVYSTCFYNSSNKYECPISSDYLKVTVIYWIVEIALFFMLLAYLVIVKRVWSSIP